MAITSLQDTQLPRFYTATVGQTSINIPFEFREDADIYLAIDGVSKTLTTDFTVSGANTNGGGSITVLSALSGDEVICVDRQRSLTRDSVLQSGPINKTTLENEFFNVYMNMQQLKSDVDRAVKLETTDNASIGTLPAKAERLGKIYGFDSTTGESTVIQAYGTWRGDYANATAYKHGDVLRDGTTGDVYFVTDDFTSTGTVATDLSNNDLAVVMDLSVATTAATTATAQADLAQKWASEAEDVLVTGNDSTSDYSAKHYRIKTAASAAAASSSETNAAASEAAAQTAQTASETAQGAAETAQTASETAQTASETAQTASETARDEAVAAAGTINGEAIADSDADTAVETERTADNDTIYLKAGGIDQMTVTASGVVIAGNMQVDGTTTIVNTTNTTISDKLLELSTGRTGTPSDDSGIIVERGDSPNVFWGWDEIANRFSAKTGSFTGSDTGNVSGSLADAGFNSLTVSGDINPVNDSTLQDIGSTGNKFSTVYADTFSGTATSAQYADLAEYYLADEALKPGTLVELGGQNEITKSKTSNVFGVVSTKPGAIMNASIKDNPLAALIAMVGRVPVQTEGTPQKGDKLVSAGNGKARKATWIDRILFKRIVGTVISDGEISNGVIEATVRFDPR